MLGMAQQQVCTKTIVNQSKSNIFDPTVNKTIPVNTSVTAPANCETNKESKTVNGNKGKTVTYEYKPDGSVTMTIRGPFAAPAAPATCFGCSGNKNMTPECDGTGNCWCNNCY